jgi:hypothetical protein
MAIIRCWNKGSKARGYWYPQSNERVVKSTATTAVAEVGQTNTPSE